MSTWTLDQTETWLRQGAQAILTITVLVAALQAVRIRIRRPIPRPHLTGPFIARLLPVLTFSTSFVSSAGAKERLRVPPSLVAHSSPAPPWSEPSGYTPSRPLARSGAPSVHPAIHPQQRAGRGMLALFPRAARRGGGASKGLPKLLLIPRSSHLHDEREASMAHHPAGSARHGIEQPSPLGSHVVRRGETLWGIAASELATDDERRIARYWPRIHHANRAVIGSNPNLIRPGQVLTLPREA